jgi:hypothetical protein
VLGRAFVWSLFILFVMATATMTAAAETRLLGGPVPDPTSAPLTNPCLVATDTNSGSLQDACERQQSYQAYLATLRKVQTPCPYVGPAAGDACAATLANNEMLAEAGEILAESGAQADATWAAGADAICQQGDPTSVGTQELCDHVSAYHAAQTPTPYPPFCQGIAAPDPRCTGN